MASYKDTYGNPDWYKKQMDSKVAQQQADQLGISQDQLFKLYAQTNQLGGIGVASQQKMSPGQIASWAAGPGVDASGQRGQLIAAPPGGNQLMQMYGPLAAWQQVTQPPPQQQPQQPQMPQLGPAQPMPTVRTQTLTPTAQYGATNTQPGTSGFALPVSASAQQTTPIFNPQPQQQIGVPVPQPGQIRQYAQGGLVQDNQQQTNQSPTIQPPNEQVETTNLLSYLGALGGGGPMVLNPTPGTTFQGGAPYGGGVSKVGSAQYYSTGGGSFQLPSGDILSQDQMNALDPASIRELQRGVGLGTVKYLTPAQSGPARQGPWMQVPSIFNPASMPQLPQSATSRLTAATPANAAQMPAAGPMPTYAPQTAAPMPAGVNYGNVAVAPPPPAPGITLPPRGTMPTQISVPQAAHASALADAGKAMYAHFGGDPSTASHADIANFHQELQGALAGGPPIKRRTGGIVPGTGNSDTVPARLTPGEFVLNKDAVRNIGLGNLQAMNTQRFEDGGEVMPREAKHKAVSDPSQYSAPAAPSTPDSGSSSSGSSGNPFVSSTPAQSAPSNWGPAGAGYQKAIGQDIDPTYGVPISQVSGLTGLSPSDVASTAGAGGGISSGQASAISGLGSAISGAFQKYAESIGSWKPQPSHIPEPSSYKRAPTPTFSSMET